MDKMPALELDLAYIAGVIDSDGTIGIKRSTYSLRVRKDSAVPTYSERVHIRQVTRQAIDVIRKRFGGNIGTEDPYAKRGKPLFRWGVTDKKAVTFITAIRPYLRIKVAQADNILALRVVKERSKRERVALGRGHVGSSARRPDTDRDMRELYERAKELNRVGI